MASLDLSALKGVPMFSTCSDEQLARVASVAEVTTHEPGSTLTREGAIGRRFHLILEGEVGVERSSRTVATLRRGDFVGEIGLLGGGRATATVVCIEPTTCLTLERQPFWHILETEPNIALRVLELVCRRMEEQWRAAPAGNLKL